jgi:hypothetical protein
MTLNELPKSVFRTGSISTTIFIENNSSEEVRSLGCAMRLKGQKKKTNITSLL